MSIATLPLITNRPTTHAVVLCDPHFDEAPATREVHYIVDPGTADEHGATIPVCDDPTCLAQALGHVESVGTWLDTVTI